VGLLTNMTVTAVVRLPGGGRVNTPGSLLAAFKDDAIRGVTTIFEVPGAGWLFMLTVGSNSAAEPGLNLKVYDAGSDRVHDLKETLDFAGDAILGEVFSPLEYTVAGGGPVNAPPVAAAVTALGPTGVATPLRLTAMDAEGDPLTFRLETLPSRGALGSFEATTGRVTYTSTAGYAGADSFSFSASDDGVRWSAPAMVSIRVQSLVLGIIQVTNGNVSTIEWGAQSGATGGPDNGIDYVAPLAVNGRAVSFVPPTGPVLLKRDVRGRLIGERWQVFAQAGSEPLTLAWDPAALPPGDWYLWQLTGRDGLPVPGTAVSLSDTGTIPAVAPLQVRYFAIGVPDPVSVTSLTPSYGVPAGATPVTIAGAGFLPGATVRFAEADAAAIEFVNSTTLTAATPPHAAGTVAVTVINPDGGRAILDAAFTYNTPPTAVAGGPYELIATEPRDLDLDGRRSSAGDAGDSLVYAWDLDGDGLYDDATGSNPTIPWATVSTLLATGTWYYEQANLVAVRVTDSFGASSTASAAVSVQPGAWTFTLGVRAGSTDHLTIGLRPGATDGFDAGLDRLGGSPAGEALTVLGDAAEGWLEDFHAYDPHQPLLYSAWVLRVTAASNEACVLDWDANRVPALGAGGLYLFEMQSGPDGGVPGPDGRLVSGGVRVDLSQAAELVVPTGQTRYFRLVYGGLDWTLRLARGWNLISLPVEPHQPAATSVFGAGGRGPGPDDRDAGRGAADGPVWTFDSARQRQQAVAELHALNGYWVFADSGFDAHLRGIPVSDRDYPLADGLPWYLVGVATRRPFEEGPDWVSPAYGWDAVAQAYRPLRSGETLEPGRGYWLYVRNRTTLNPQAPP
jgi:hypothetical protein